MAFGSASQIQVRRVREATQGVLPAGAMQILTFETFTIKGPISREQPGNVSANRQVTDNPAQNIKVSGSAKNDFSHGDWQGLIEELFQSTMLAGVTVTAATISIVGATPSLHNTAGGSWSGFSDKDFVLVSGFSTSNPAVFMSQVNGAPTSSDLTLSLEFGAGGAVLANETAGASITVQHAGRHRLGTTMLTAAYEEWNSNTSVGKSDLGIGVTQLALSVPQPNKCSMAWTFEGVTSAKIGSQAVNTSTAWSGNGVINSNKHFGDSGHSTAGLGFRYGAVGSSALAPTVRIKQIDVTIMNPLDPEGGAGTLGPIDISPDARFDVKVKLKLFRNGAAATETIIGDAENSASIVSIGFGFISPEGHRQYMWMPNLQPNNESTTGVQQKGREYVDAEYVAKMDAAQVIGMLQWNYFT